MFDKLWDFKNFCFSKLVVSICVTNIILKQYAYGYLQVLILYRIHNGKKHEFKCHKLIKKKKPLAMFKNNDFDLFIYLNLEKMSILIYR